MMKLNCDAQEGWDSNRFKYKIFAVLWALELSWFLNFSHAFLKLVKPSLVYVGSIFELFSPKYLQTKQNAAFLDLLYSNHEWFEYHLELNLKPFLLDL